MNVLILGSGCLGKSLSSIYSDLAEKVTLLSVRQGFDVALLKKCDYDLVLDCMDLPHENFENYIRKQSFINSLRVKILSLTKPDLYLYCSTSNLYKPSNAILDESSELLCQYHLNESKYLRNKFEQESMLLKLSCLSAKVLRIASLWQESYHNSTKSFFKDLMNSYQSQKVLSPRVGDENVITCLHYRDAAILISYLANNNASNTRILNISSGFWISRTSLKIQRHLEADSFTLGRRVLSKYYSPSDMIKPLKVF